MEFNGVNVTGPLDVAGAGGPDAWTDVSIPRVRLAEGEQYMKLVSEAGRSTSSASRRQRIDSSPGWRGERAFDAAAVQHLLDQILRQISVMIRRLEADARILATKPEQLHRRRLLLARAGASPPPARRHSPARREPSRTGPGSPRSGSATPRRGRIEARPWRRPPGPPALRRPLQPAPDTPIPPRPPPFRTARRTSPPGTARASRSNRRTGTRPSSRRTPFAEPTASSPARVVRGTGRSPTRRTGIRSTPC